MTLEEIPQAQRRPVQQESMEGPLKKAAIDQGSREGDCEGDDG